MKASARAIRRPNDGHAVTEHPRNELVIPLPDPRLLRLIARLVFLAAAVISLPWLRSALFSDLVSDAIPVSNSPEDELFYMPKLLQDMKAHGLIQPQGCSLFLGDPGLHAALLWRNGISILPENKIWQITQGQSLDFVFLSAGGISDAHFRLIDSLMRVGGVAAFRLAPHPAKPFNLPANYRMVYIQNIGLTIIAVKKLYQDNDGSGQPERRLLSVPATKEHALQVQAMEEDAVLEQPVVKKRLKIIRYLPPELLRESLTIYPRRVFVDMGSPGRVGSELGFKKNYPKRNAANDGGSGDKGEWMMKKVGKEYVMVTAESEAAPEMVKGRAIVLVGELFLDCRSRLERVRGEEVELQFSPMVRLF